MIGLIQSRAASGDLEAINTLEMLRAIGVIKDEPKEAKELKLWEIFDQAIQWRKIRSNRYQKSAGRQSDDTYSHEQDS